MAGKEFEKDIQGQLQELKFTPDDLVWQKVEASLPGKRRRRMIPWLLIPLCIGGAVMIYQSQKDIPSKSIAKTNTSAGKTKPKEQNDEKHATTHAVDPTNYDVEKTMAESPVGIVKTNTQHHKPGEHHFLKHAIFSGNEIVGAHITTAETVKNNEEKSSVLTSGQQASGDALIAQANTDIGQSIFTAEINKTAADTNIADTNVALETSAASAPTDTNATSLPVDNHEKNKISRKWRLAFEIAAGRSNVNEGSWLRQMSSADYTSNSPGTVTGNNPGYYKSADRSPGFAFATGLIAEKKISQKWTFRAGLEYGYYSNKLNVGQRVDSVFAQNYGGLALLSRGYYRSGAGAEFTNRLHVLQLPLQVQFRPLRFPVYLETGLSVAYLAGTNMLQYNSSGNLYFHDRSVFNKWLLQVQAGIGVDLTSSQKLPVKFGYRFESSLTSLVKELQGEQHLLSSRLYLDFYLKK